MKNYKSKMLKINFFLRNSEKATPERKLKIYVVLELDGHERDVPFSTGLSVPKMYWKGDRVDQGYIWAEELNQDLNELQLKFKMGLQILKTEESEITYKSIRAFNETQGKKVKLKATKSFIEVYDMMVKDKATIKNLTAGTRVNYNNYRNNILELLENLNSKNAKVDCFDLELVEKFVSHFRDKIGEEYINKHCRAIRNTFEFAIKKKLMRPISLWKLDLKGCPPKDPHYIHPQKRQEIKNVKLPSLQDTKRIAIFLWSTGFSYNDYLALKPHHLIATSHGMCWRKRRGKSKVFSMPALLPDAAEILDYYGGVDNLPRPHLTDFNTKLRILGECAGITDENTGWHLTSSACRETFSSMMENEYMVDSRVVMVMMGWTNPRQMRAYSTVQPERVMHELLVKGVNMNLLKLSS